MTNYSDLAIVPKMIENRVELYLESDLMDIHLSQPLVLGIDMPLRQKEKRCAKKSSHGKSSSSRRDGRLGDDFDEDDPPPPSPIYSV